MEKETFMVTMYDYHTHTPKGLKGYVVATEEEMENLQRWYNNDGTMYINRFECCLYDDKPRDEVEGTKCVPFQVFSKIVRTAYQNPVKNAWADPELLRSIIFAVDTFAFLIKGGGEVSGRDFSFIINESHDCTKSVRNAYCAWLISSYIKRVSVTKEGRIDTLSLWYNQPDPFLS